MSRLLSELQQAIARYDLLSHPFYQAWSCGELSREDPREYSTAYYQQVAAFPTFLSALHSRLADGELRRAVLRNLADEEIDGRAHSDLWLDFAEAMGADAVEVRRPADSTMQRLTASFREIASSGSLVAALAAFYAYESQVPRVAASKVDGLVQWYGAQKNDKACRYFTLHTAADVQHSRVWAEELGKLVGNDEALRAEAVASASRAAQALWEALDGIEAARQLRRAA